MIRDAHTHSLLSADGIISVSPDFTCFDPSRHYSVGIHPWLTAGEDINRLAAKLAETANRREVIAIGETGIDHMRGGNLQIQENLFRQHIELSERLSKPIIIHNVRGLDTIMRLHKEYDPGQPWIIHGFRGNSRVAAQLASRGIYFSLGERFNADVPSAIPPSLILAETDESDMPIESIAARIYPADPSLPFRNLGRLTGL